MNAVLYRYRTGIPWRDLPECLGDWNNTHRRHSRVNPFNVRPEPNFVDLLRRRGINITARTTTQFGAQEAAFSDIILAVTDAHKSWVLPHFPETKGKVFTLGEYVAGGQQEVQDPFGKPMDVYKVFLGQLDQMVGAAVMKATAGDSD